MQNVLRIAAILYFGSADWWIILEVCFIVGLWPLLRKSGIKGWWSLVPFGRDYMFARCAGCEKEGRVLLVLRILSTAVSLAGKTVDIMSFSISAIALALALMMVIVIYGIRIYKGMTDTYGKSRWWIPVWIFANGIAALIWGFSPSFTPKDQAHEHEIDDRIEEEKEHGKHTWFGDLGGNFKRLLRYFAFRHDWVNLPIAVLITTIVASIAKADFFTTMDGTIKGSLALTCIAVWNGCFNSIKTVCRERRMIRRLKDGGMYLSSYIVSVMVYQAVMCILQTILTMYTCTIIGIQFPYEGLVISNLTVEIAVTMFLISFASDLLCLCVSALVREVSTAMTVMPFILVIQLVFSGSIINIQAWSHSISKFTISNYGVKCIASQADYNNRPMVLGWNLLESIKDNEVGTQFTVGEIIDTLDADDPSPGVQKLRDTVVGRVFTVGELRDMILGSEMADVLLDQNLNLDMSIGELIDILREHDIIPTTEELKDQTFGKVFTMQEIYGILNNVEAFQKVKDKKILFNLITVGDTLDTIMIFLGDMEINASFKLGQLIDTIMDSAFVKELMEKRPLQGYTFRMLLEKAKVFETLDRFQDTEIDARITVGEIIDALVSLPFVQNYRNQEIVLKAKISALMDIVGEDTVRDFVLEKTTQAVQVPEYAHTRENVLDYWNDLLLFVLLFGIAFIAIMEISMRSIPLGLKKKKNPASE